MNISERRELEFIADSIMIETYLVRGSNNSDLVKVAFDLSGMFGKVGDFVKQIINDNWDPQNPAASIMALGASGLMAVWGGWWGVALDVFCQDFLGFKFLEIFKPICNMIAQAIKGKKIISFPEISSKIDQMLPGGGAAASAPELDESKADDKTAEEIMTESKLVFSKMSAVYNMADKMIVKTAFGIPDMLRAAFKMFKVPFTLVKSFIGRILKFIFRVAWKALRTVVVKGVIAPVTTMLGGHPHRDGSNQPNHNLVPNMQFGQTIEPGNWAEGCSLEQAPTMISNWVFSLYPQLMEKQSEVIAAIQSSSKFKELYQAIRDNNEKTTHNEFIYMPLRVGGFQLRRRADVVNYFIQDVVDKVGL